MQTSIIVVLTVVALTRCSATILDIVKPGGVALYEQPDFKGGSPLVVPVHGGNICYNIGCFDNRAQSARWKLFPNGRFNGDSYLAIYADSHCRGYVDLWKIRDKDFPRNFTRRLNKQASSFMVLQTAFRPKKEVANCANDTFFAGYDESRTGR